MTMQLFNWLSFTVVIFSALMVLIRFSFYSRRDVGMQMVAFWGACLFLALGLFDMTSSMARGEVVSVGKVTLFVGLSVGMMVRFMVGRQKVESSSVQQVDLA